MCEFERKTEEQLGKKNLREKEEDFWGKRALENFGQQLGAERERATSFGRKEAEFEVEATHEVRSRVWFYGIHCIYSGLRCIRLRSSLLLGLF